MSKRTPSKLRARRGATPTWPMRGAVLSRLAAAFRLRQAVLLPRPEQSSEQLPESRARRAFVDHPDIGRTNQVQLLRAAVDELFSEDYLVARGLGVPAGTRHNDLVTGAIDVVLSRWERMALFANVSGDRAEEMLENAGMLFGLWEDFAVRLAAYEQLYGHVHPFLGDLPTWFAQPKLSGCWRGIEARAEGRLKVSNLYEKGVLSPKTIRDLRDGKTLPKESTLPALAERLAGMGVRVRFGDRMASAGELLVELRAATALAAEAPFVRVLFGATPTGFFVQVLAGLRALLGTAPDEIVSSFLRSGMQSVYWAKTRQLLVAMSMNKLDQAVAEGRRASQRAVERAGGGIEAAAELLALSASSHLHDLRSFKRRPGDDGPEQRLIELFEFQHELARYYQGARKECPSLRGGFDEEFEADGLYFEVLSDRSLTDVEQERKLRAAVAICERSAHARRALAYWLAEHDAAGEAVEQLRRAVQLNPANVEGRERLLELLASTGAFAEAIAVPANDVSVFCLGVRAACLVEVGDFVAAKSLAAAIVADHPRHAIALRALAACSRAEGRDTEARRLEAEARFYGEGVGMPGK